MTHTTAIIGAGMAGLAAARVLADRGQAVVLFDKGRGPGGRMSTRRADSPLGELRFDHGAQFFTVRDPAFAAAVEGWQAAGAAAIWQGRFVAIGADGHRRPLREDIRLVGAPGMNGVIRAAAGGLDVRWSVRVARIGREGARWRLRDESGADHGLFDAVILAVPAEQAPALLPPEADAMAAQARAVTSAPCWAGMFAFDTLPDCGFDAARIDNGGPLAWIAREDTKPGRAGPPRWTVHASPLWSRAHLEASAEDAATVLLTALQALTGAAAPVFTATHRWRFAQVEAGAGSACAWDNALRLGLCGDWRLGARVEAAWLSGTAAGQAALTP